MKLQNADMIKKSITVHISDAKVSADPAHILATYSLGSCVGVCLYSRSVQAGGMLHYLLPDSKENPQRARENPFMYADTGMKCLLEKFASMGIKKHQIMVKVAGGAERLKTVSKAFNIGKRNYLAIRKILWKNGMFITSEDVGGVSPRTLYMNIADGGVIIRANGLKRNL